MNREILFKAKRIDNGEWAEGYIVIYPSGKCEIHKRCVEPPDILAVYEVDPSTICQYTGLTDRIGKEIWENDICIIHSSPIDEEDGYFAIEWDDDGARFALYGEGLTVDFDNYHGYECEVIGNTFDNPELLGGD